MYEIYEVPNEKLNGTEIYVTESHDKQVAYQLAQKQMSFTSNPVWVIKASDNEGYEKVIST